jgi:hypothetical protein
VIPKMANALEEITDKSMTGKTRTRLTAEKPVRKYDLLGDLY